jgi:hypothetical protein
MDAHDSDSAAQRGAERLILDEVERTVGRSLSPTRLTLAGGASVDVDVDGVAEDQSVLVEVFANQGALKGGQRHKIATDVLKLITIARVREPKPRMVLAAAEPRFTEWYLPLVALPGQEDAVAGRIRVEHRADTHPPNPTVRGQQLLGRVLQALPISAPALVALLLRHVTS